MKKPKTPLIYRTPEQPIDTMESDQHARWEASQAAKQELVTITRMLLGMSPAVAGDLPPPGPAEESAPPALQDADAKAG